MDQKQDPISLSIRRRQSRLATKQAFIDLMVKALLIGLFGWLLFTQVFLITRNTGNEMFPALKDGDLVLVFRLQSDYKKDDVVSYLHDGKRRIGRVAAIAGDHVMLDDSGTLSVNGTVQAGEIVYPTYAKPGWNYPFQVAQDMFFILGDNRLQATDSRDFGAINKHQLEGKVITLLRRRGL